MTPACCYKRGVGGGPGASHLAWGQAMLFCPVCRPDRAWGRNCWFQFSFYKQRTKRIKTRENAEAKPMGTKIVEEFRKGGKPY